MIQKSIRRVSAPLGALMLCLAATIWLGVAGEPTNPSERPTTQKGEPEITKVAPLPDMEVPAGGWGSLKPDPQVQAMADNSWMQLKTKFVPDGAESANGMKFGKDFHGFGHPKGESCLVYDEARNLTVWFGGCSSGYTNQTVLISVSDATYFQAQPEHVEALFKGHQKVAGPNHPMGQCSYGACYDPNTKLYIKGRGITASFVWENPVRCWSYDVSTNKWEDLGPGGPRGWGCYKMVYDRDSKICVLFGGLGIDGTWLFDVAKRQWRQAKIDGKSPPSRMYASMVYDEKNKKTVLFGGSSGVGQNSAPSNETWTFDSTTSVWTQMNPKTSPSPRKMAAMAYDSANGVCILVGGNDTLKSGDPKPVSDTWVYDLAKDQWQEMNPPNQPPAIGVYQAAYDRVNNVTVYVGIDKKTSLYRYKQAAF